MSDKGVAEQETSVCDQPYDSNSSTTSLLPNSRTKDLPHYATVKIVIVGLPGCGKSALSWRLAYGAFKEESPKRLQCLIMKDLSTVQREDTKCDAVLWDLPGGPDYQMVHTLFLDDADLAIVVFDPARPAPLNGVEYWLKALSYRRQNRCLTILVGARTDRGDIMMVPDDIEAFCHSNNIEGGYIAASARTGEGVDELAGCIQRCIVSNQKKTTVMTSTFKLVRDSLLKMKEDDSLQNILLSVPELHRQIKSVNPKSKFTRLEMMKAVRHLANFAFVSVLRRSSGKESILLAPDLLLDLTQSFVDQARRNKDGLGALEEGMVRRGEFDFPEVAGLKSWEKETLLDAATVLFLEHNVCFRKMHGKDTYLIFPALITQKKPLLDEVEMVEDVTYIITGAVETVYATLVVLLGYTNIFTRTNQWENQARYELDGREICGFRQIAEREGEIELVLYYGSNYRKSTRRLFEAHFERFLEGCDVTAIKYLRLSCPRCSELQGRNIVIKRIQQKRGHIFCAECQLELQLPEAGKKVALSSKDRTELERQQKLAKRRTGFEKALTYVKAYIRDRDSKTKFPTCFISYAWDRSDYDNWVEKTLATDLRSAEIEVILDRWHNAEIAANIARFISRIEKADFIAVVGTPLYKKKYENKGKKVGAVVAAEADLIQQRLLTGTEKIKKTVLPLLLDGQPHQSLPPLMRVGIYADFRKEESYFMNLFDLILTLYGIPFDSPAVADLRGSLSEKV